MADAASKRLEHATSYEEWLLRYKGVQEELSKGDSLEENVERSRELLCCGLAARAGVPLHVAALQDPDPALSSLLHHTSLSMDRDSASKAQMRPLVALEATCDSQKFPPMRLVSPNDLDVDAFFEEYPECAKSAYGESETEDEESDIEEKEKVPKKLSKAVISLCDDEEPAYKEAGPAKVAAQRNPYQSTMNFSHTMPPQQYRAAQSTQAPTRVQHGRGASWEDVRQQNPFQSAREYAHAGGDDEPQRITSSHQKTSYQSAEQFVPDPAQQSIRGSSIPESLKRKFQPPKRNQQDISGGAGSKKKGQILSNGGASVARPSSSRSDQSDDDDLPEALKGLDKELIEKIQNEIMDSGDSITFGDIAGLADAKQTVQELVCWPMKRPDLFTGLRRGPNGLLLFGPPGTGKTLIGKAIAHESGATFFSISSSSLTSKWIGEGEKLVRTLFAVAAFREPAVVFIDEIDSLLTQRKADENEASRRIKTEFLVQLDGTGSSGQGRVLCIGATNRPQELDDAVRRRFVKRLYIPLPVQADRETLLRTLLVKNRHCLSDKEFSKLSMDTDGFSGADLKALCTEAAMGPIRQLGSHALEIDPSDVPPIGYKHFRQATRATTPSVAQADLEIYVQWNETYGTKNVGAFDDDDEEEESDNDKSK